MYSTIFLDITATNVSVEHFASIFRVGEAEKDTSVTPCGKPTRLTFNALHVVISYKIVLFGKQFNGTQRNTVAHCTWFRHWYTVAFCTLNVCTVLKTL